MNMDKSDRLTTPHFFSGLQPQKNLLCPGTQMVNRLNQAE